MNNIQNFIVRYSKNNDSISVTNLPENKLAVITEWTIPEYIGLLIIRFDDIIYQVGASLDNSWTFSKLKKAENKDPSRFMIKILEEDDMILVKN